MRYTILDGYTDEPSGLGVPPYLGVYPRYIAGRILAEDPSAKITYLTIDDMRALEKGLNKKDAKELKEKIKTNISIYNLTGNDVSETIENSDVMICIVGVQTPGKYLSARPATLSEMTRLTKKFSIKKILTGPAISSFGTQVMGGKFAENISKFDLDGYELEEEDTFNDYSKIKEFAIKGSVIASQFPKPFIAEIELSRGCFRNINCSFCTEPLADCQSFREQSDIVAEMKSLYDTGARNFRLGRATCIYSYKNNSSNEIEILFKSIWKACPKIEVLHIDNANPAMVITENGIKITKLIVKYCTEGNIAAFGCETFDPDVVKLNDLNSTPETSMKAIQIVNKYGAERGVNGLPKFLPGINILFGLIGESKKTHKCNMEFLTKVVDEGLLLRRINIRQVVPFPGTKLFKEAKNKFLKKNQRYYYRWRDDIRQKIDVPMLRSVFTEGMIIKNVLLEIYDGNTTFGRQIATYPVVIGIKGRHPLRTWHDVEIVGYMKRSLTGKIVNEKKK
jgi:radical SAM superfamily enzyme with C-terminal helix-hairpin-helix motif